MASLNSLAPVLPVSDVLAALDNYALLGFRAKPYQRAEVVAGRGVSEVMYGFLFLDAIQIHVCQVAGIEPQTNLSEVYLYVDDAKALHQKWCDSGATGSFIEPTDTEYGLCEGAYVDPDGNSLRYGSWLPGFPKDAQR
ncbi:MAG: hypothetical protein MUF33_04895 [Candidatus Nanopelagicales bacterium]|jgi:hypothetical protein|nr:hypothetical protein [Candidatus Nanopelagicales bacterium]MCU0297844.1 hypothetical protein [Candidatus Nanopelagicales bacterium]